MKVLSSAIAFMLSLTITVIGCLLLNISTALSYPECEVLWIIGMAVGSLGALCMIVNIIFAIIVEKSKEGV